MKASPECRRGCWKAIKWGCGSLLFLLAGLTLLVWLCLHRVPKSYPPVRHPIPAPAPGRQLEAGLEGFASPYLGHTGSWDGKGGALGGRPKTADLDKEAAMGLRWTFMPVYWRTLEPDGPVDLSKALPPAWQALDAFVIAAQQRKLNILFQAPVVGGNAGGPPKWAGRREPGKSAPADMEAVAAFAAKLAARYAPGGTLARQQGWASYGVRAWELDNEPDGYLTHWKGQAADYAEFVTKVAAAIRQVDAPAVMVGPSVMGGGKAPAWVAGALDAHHFGGGSPEFQKQAKPYSIGPVLDVVSFHVYEGLDSAFSGQDRTVEMVFGEIRQVFEQWEERAAGFAYPRKQEYWHTEGNFDFFGVLPAERRAAWRLQFFTRAFAAGIRKVAVMDASKPEQAAVRAYVQVLPNPFPVERAETQARILNGRPVVFWHRDSTNATAGRVWVVWATAGTGEATVEIPCLREAVSSVSVDGVPRSMTPTNGLVQLHLQGDAKMAPPVLLIDRPYR